MGLDYREVENEKLNREVLKGNKLRLEDFRIFLAVFSI